MTAQEAWEKLKKVTRGPKFHIGQEGVDAIDKALANKPKKSLSKKSSNKKD